MFRIRTALAVAVTLSVAALAVNARRTAAPASPAAPGAAVVERVVDGDTVRVRLGGRIERVRLIGVDTPESVKPNTPVECFAKEASARTAALLPAGTPVRLVRDLEARDKYGRLLAYVYRAADGLFVNLSLAADGYAAPLTIPPNVAHAEDFAAAAGRARTGRRGLWGRCTGPHEATGSELGTAGDRGPP